MKQWLAFMRRNVPQEEIAGKWLPKYHSEDRPAKLVDHLRWMAEIGFADVDVLWKYYNFAAYGGVKPLIRCVHTRGSLRPVFHRRDIQQWV